MIPAWISKAILPVIIVAALLLAAAFVALKVVGEVKSFVATTKQEARSERDAYWTAQIEKANALAAQAEAAQAREALRINTDTAKIIADQRSNLITLRKANADLPNGGAIGLDRARVQLLPD